MQVAQSVQIKVAEINVPKLLTTEQVRAYQAEGYVFPVRVFSAAQAAEYRTECDGLETLLGGRPKTVEVRQMHQHFVWAYRLITEPLLLDAVEELLGENLLVSATELFAKHPRNAAVSIAWHRDGVYMGLDPARTVTAWVALSRSISMNGGMQVVREADRIAAASAASSCRQSQGKVPHVLPPGEIISVELEPGEMSLHDVHVLHGSGGNDSDEKRVGFAIRFTTPATRPTLARPPAMLVRGRDDYGHFELIDPPVADNPEQALPALRTSARMHLEGTLQTLKQLAR